MTMNQLLEPLETIDLPPRAQASNSDSSQWVEKHASRRRCGGPKSACTSDLGVIRVPPAKGQHSAQSARGGRQPDCRCSRRGQTCTKMWTIHTTIDARNVTSEAVWCVATAAGAFGTANVMTDCATSAMLTTPGSVMNAWKKRTNYQEAQELRRQHGQPRAREQGRAQHHKQQTMKQTQHGKNGSKMYTMMKTLTTQKTWTAMTVLPQRLWQE